MLTYPNCLSGWLFHPDMYPVVRHLPYNPVTVVEGDWDETAPIPFGEHPFVQQVWGYISGGNVPDQWRGRVRKKLKRRQHLLTEEELGAITAASQKRFLVLWDSLRQGFKEQPYGNNINVAVGRDGRLFALDGGVHRLAICYVLGIPVKLDIRVRHPLWVAFREKLASHGKPYYTALPHPDLQDIIHSYGPSRVERILENVGDERGSVLDLGTRTGLACHMLEDEGFTCHGVDYDPTQTPITRQLKDVQNRKWTLTEGNILELDSWDCDVLVALNVLRYVHTKPRCAQLLAESNIGQIFFMTTAQRRRMPKRFGSQDRFAAWVAEAAGKTKVDIIGSEGSRILYHIR